jgi:ribosomal protein S18 acetylase RimI-like enzyme
MTTISQTLGSPASHLRPFDVGRDLDAVADLVETCFADTLDEDGKRYVQQMHAAARNPRYLRWASAVADNVSMPLSGYVWEENGYLAGNLSLIPFLSQGRRYYLIANVAVDPIYRRRGIARAMTRSALEHAYSRGAAAVWLHVREENLAAFNLYQLLGFRERARRTTWEWSTPGRQSELQQIHLPPGIAITQRQRQHWNQQRIWLKNIYPPALTWHLPFRLTFFQPGLVGSLYRFFNDTVIKQWSATQGRDLIGVLSWQPHLHHADHLWLACGPETEDQAISSLLPFVRRELTDRRRMTLDFPARLGQTAFEAAGFYVQQTLIWMSTILNREIVASDRTA